MMSELGLAIAPPAFHPARTTGFGGFALSLQASYAHINADARDSNGTQYWHQGTQGSLDPSTNKFSNVNSNPDSILQVYTLKARKGLALRLRDHRRARVRRANTSLWVGGADVHWALLEGFRTGLLGYLPDVAVGGGVRTLGGSPKFFLTTVGIDAQVSKPFALADSSVLTPYVGAQRLSSSPTRPSSASRPTSIRSASAGTRAPTSRATPRPRKTRHVRRLARLRAHS